MTVGELILETVEHIAKNGRAVGKGGDCRYRTEDGENGCAVGRCLADDKYREEFESLRFGVLVRDYASDDHNHLFKEKYKGFPKKFWVQLQSLHDNHAYWEFGKISDDGMNWIQILLNNYAEDDVKAEDIIPKKLRLI